MAQDFESSRERGPHRLWGQLAGSWNGRARTWFEPGELADESAIEGRLRLELGGRFLAHRYRTSLQGRAVEGFALIGFDLSLDQVQVSWADTFHMGTGLMRSTGSTWDKRGFSVLGQYADPSGGAPWGWRTILLLEDDDALTITHYNIDPHHEVEAKAVEIVYQRAKEKA